MKLFPHPAGLAPVLGLTALLGACTSSIGPVDGFGQSTGDCAAANYEPMVGQNVAVLNDAELPDGFRVHFPGAEIGDETQPGRLNFTIGTDDTISRVYCG